MTKTAKEIQGDFISFLRGTTLASAVNGQIYRKGYRPRDSKAEDIVVTFMSGRTSQIQTGIVLVQIFVPDIDPFNNGVFVEDGARTEQLERTAQDWLNNLNPATINYKISLNGTISTDYDEDINQHFVVMMLDYYLFN